MACTNRIYRIEDFIWEPAMRCGGGVTCEICGKEYYDHKPEMNLLYDGYPFLTVLCNGERVKL